MIRLRFGTEDLLRVRFAISPLFELNWSIAVLVDPAASALHAPWSEFARRAVAGLDIRVLAALLAHTGGYAPDFLSPPPGVTAPALRDELQRVRAVPPEQVRREVAQRIEVNPESAERLRPLLEDPARELPAIVDLMARYWELAIAPWWPQLRALLEADVDRRSRALARGGAEALFADLHPDVTWQGSALEVRRATSIDVTLGGRGVLLLPSAFAWPDVFAIVDEPWQPSLVYTPRAVGELWAPPAVGEPLAELLGDRRAAILVALSAPSTTIDLAERLGASPASVSEHLGVLRRSGLASSDRDGRRVRYRRTRAGDSLIRAARDAS